MRNVLRHLLRPLAKCAAFGLVVPVLWLIEPFWRIRITHLWSARFGPLCFTTHTWVVRRRLEGRRRRTSRIFFGAKPANRQLWEMWKRQLPIIDSRALSAFYHYAGPGLTRTRFFTPLPEEFAEHSLVNHPAGLTFTADEERRGRALLEQMGIGESDWFVTFQARDPLYHISRGTGDSGSHRDCAISTFLPAARHIVAQGGVAVRMGATAEKPLPESEGRIVDYARQHRSDFGDLWLFSRCRFHLGCSTGSLFCPVLWNRPIVQVNMMPLRPCPTGRSGLYAPVLLRDKASGRLATFKELDKLGAYEYDDPALCARWQYPGGLDACGLEIVNNTEEEILDACKDMFAQLQGIPVLPEVHEIQLNYKKRFFSHIPTIGDGPNLAPSFIRRYPQLFED